MARSPASSQVLLGSLAPLCFAAAVPAHAQAEPPTPQVAESGRSLGGLSAAQLFDIADQARVAQRNADAEAIYKALARDPDLKVRSEARFRHGMMLADEKRYQEAALAFRAVIDEEPDAAPVRLELARVLAAMGDEGRARQQIRQAQASGLPPEVAQVVDRFAAALRSNRTFGGNFELAMAPDSNVNRATDAKTLDVPLAPLGPLELSPDARQQSGIGVHTTGQVYARLKLSPQVTLVPRISGDGTFYRKSQFNDLSGSALVGVEWQSKSGRDRVTPSVGKTWRTYGGDAYARTTNFDLRWTHRLGQRAQSDVAFSYGRTHYVRNALQDGNLFSLTASVERALTARTGIGVSANVQRQTARDPQFANTAGGVTILGWRDMGKTTLFANATVRRLESDAPYFGGLFARRKEWYLRGGVGATFRQVQVAGFSPVIRASYERNISNVGIFDYQRKTIDIGITRAF